MKRARVRRHRFSLRRTIRGAMTSGTSFTGPQLRFLVLGFFLLVCAVGGGASRPDVMSLLYLRPAAVLCLAGLLLIPGPWNFGGLRAPLFLLTAFAAVMAMQLVPLPPALWAALPGHAPYVQAAVAAGVHDVWRPISLTPDLTWNSLLALLTPLTILVGMAGIDEDRRRTLLIFIVGVACLSAFLGIVQLSSSARSPAFLYAVTHRASAVGLFANRNHEAVLLALCLPLLRVWTLAASPHHGARQFRLWFAAGMGLFLVAMILVTGSRAGLVAGALGLIAAFALAPWRSKPAGEGYWARLPKVILWLALIVIVALAILFGRAVAFQRLIRVEDLAHEQRITNMPTMMEMVRDFFPMGSGFGSFDPVFRAYEPDAALRVTYFNHAHNELVELALTGGMAAILVLIAFLAWWAPKALAVFRPFRGRSQSTLLARAGVTTTLLLMLGSIVDYPLRTPLLAAIFTIACGWLATASFRQSLPAKA